MKDMLTVLENILNDDTDLRLRIEKSTKMYIMNKLIDHDVELADGLTSIYYDHETGECNLEFDMETPLTNLASVLNTGLGDYYQTMSRVHSIDVVFKLREEHIQRD